MIPHPANIIMHVGPLCGTLMYTCTCMYTYMYVFVGTNTLQPSHCVGLQGAAAACHDG